MLKKLVKSFTDDGYTLDNSDPWRIILWTNEPGKFPVVKIERCLPAIRNNEEEWLARKFPELYPRVYEYTDDFQVIYCEEKYDWHSLN